VRMDCNRKVMEWKNYVKAGEQKSEQTSSAQCIFSVSTGKLALPMSLLDCFLSSSQFITGRRSLTAAKASRYEVPNAHIQ